MCGIAGILHSSLEAPRGTLEAMSARLAHRGPDGSGIYLNRNVGMVHTRLSIIDLDGGAQPLESPAEGLALVANGEVYNYVELRRELSSDGRVFRTGSDCETILHAYARDGLAGFERLNGMFAAAIHDRCQDRLVLVRDRLGIKPLFYAKTAGGWAFASEVKGLLPARGRAVEVNAGALAEYLHGGLVSAPEKLVQGVHAVPPGCAVILESGKAPITHRYWDLRGIEPFGGSEAEALEQFSTLMHGVMAEHVRADVPYGLFLSGGVDSGTLAGLLAASASSPLATYSVGFEGSGRHNELDDAERIARLFGTRHRRISIAPGELHRQVVEAVWAADDLIQDSAVLPTLVLARHAARELKVVFSGEGGDEVFAGYGRYRVQGGRRLVAALDRRGGGLGRRSRWERQAREACFGTMLRAAHGRRRDAVCGVWSASPQAWGAVRRRQYVDLGTSLPDGLLVKLDRSLMALGLEGRVPFLDHRVVEFGLSLPDSMKIGGRQRKLFLKRWAERLLPADHLYGKKRGFHVPLAPIIRGPMVPALEDLLPASRAVQEWFRPEGVRDLLRRQAVKGDRGGEVWSLLSFVVWHRLFVEADGRRPPTDVPLVEFLADSAGLGRRRWGVPVAA